MHDIIGLTATIGAVVIMAPRLEAMNKAYVEGLQAQGKAIRFVPFAETVGTDANTTDLTHPNATGYTLWANELAPKVRELFPQ